MRKYEDVWVVDRTMFEYVNQGGCSCCGISHTIMDIASFADRCSDWESEDEKKEQFSPWPAFIHEEILHERARLRLHLKDTMTKYRGFLDNHFKAFAHWWSRLDDKARVRIFQIADEDLTNYFRVQANIKGSYDIVLCAVSEQLRHFKDTGYKDGRVTAELVFENALYHRGTSFAMQDAYVCSDQGVENFLEMLHILAGPKLLPVRSAKTQVENNEAEEEQAESEANVQSFRSDRRLLRLVICRFFADAAMRRFAREVDPSIDSARTQQQEEDDDTEGEDEDDDQEEHNTASRRHDKNEEQPHVEAQDDDDHDDDDNGQTQEKERDQAKEEEHGEVTRGRK